MPATHEYNKRYYREHKAAIALRKKVRYQRDAQYRERILAVSRERYRCATAGKKKRTSWNRGFNRPRAFPIGGKLILCRSAADAASRIGCKTQTLRVWEKEGIIPPPTIRDELRRRWYSEDYIAFLAEQLRLWREKSRVLAEFKRAVWDARSKCSVV